MSDKWKVDLYHYETDGGDSGTVSNDLRLERREGLLWHLLNKVREQRERRADFHRRMENERFERGKEQG